MSSAMTPFRADALLPTLQRLRTPWTARAAARLLVVAFIALPFVLLFVPWQQTVRGRGQIVAFSPTERTQVVAARVGGQIRKWHVTEGTRVKVGDPIVDIDDNDPELAKRLEAQRRILQSRQAQALKVVGESERVIAARQNALDAAVAAAKEKVNAAKKIVAVAEREAATTRFSATFETARFQMYESLHAGDAVGPLQSRLSRDEAKLRADKAGIEVAKADAEIDKARAEMLAAEAAVELARASGISGVASARGDLGKANQDLLAVEIGLQEIDSRIARFGARHVTASAGGVVFRIFANVGEGGQYVKEGDQLALIVPDSNDRVVELFIDGVDAPLVSAHMHATGVGPHVRLQFEGWPAVQFAGWPSVAVGTFGGRVRQIDPTDDGYGRFRVLIEPDPLFDGDEWPAATFLRQGNQAIGWVFLNRVTLGFELWRQFNGFPPVIAPKSPDKKDAAKPPKIKVA